MSDDQFAFMAAQVLGDIVKQVSRQSAAVERLGTAAESIAHDVSALLATNVIAVLVHPWANDRRDVRVVLVPNQEEERRLKDSVQRHEIGDHPVPLDEWLKKDGFRVVETRDVAPERQGLTTFKAAESKHAALTGAGQFTDASLEHLELEHKVE
jgi:hypothetical protein